VSSGGAVEIDTFGIFTRRSARRRGFRRAGPSPLKPITRSPGAKSVTPVPTLSTIPANSDAGENGNGGLCWYLPAHDQQVEEIERRGLDPHDGLAGSGCRLRDVGSSSSSGGAKMSAEDGFMAIFHSGRGADASPESITAERAVIEVG